MKKTARRAWLSWASVIVLAVLCGVLGFLQYRSIGEISAAEKTRLHEELRTRLDALRRDFDEEISGAALALMPPSPEQYARWRRSHGRIFRRIAMAVPDDGQPQFLNLNLDTGQFSPAGWPPDWESTRQQITAHLNGGPTGPPNNQPDGLVFEIPRFVPSEGAAGQREKDWLIVEVNSDYLRDTLIPGMLTRYFGETGQRDYDVEVIEAADPQAIVYRSVSTHGEVVSGNADESIPLLSPPPPNAFGRGRGGFGPPGRPRFQRGPRAPGTRGPDPRGPEPGRQGRLRLLVRHRMGSLEALVAQTRTRNLAISAAVLLLILMTAGMLVRFSRQSQRLAELQINFVAGVSHELRTPLTVIRTAAYNLRGTQLHNRPEQIERYGRLIETESRKLEDVVEQVLRFASVKAGHVIRDLQPVPVGKLVEEELESSRAALEGKAVVLEEHLGSGLPVVLADARALRHAFQNLMDNAVKYGTNGSGWIGVYTEAVIDEKGAAAQIRIADRGPGIPADEQERIFDPFFRGRRAVQDQTRGTGLGLNLVKTIVEAHGGTITVMSDPANGTAFTVRLPAAPKG